MTYEIVVFKRQPNKLAPPELKEIHPLGKSPVIKVEPPASTGAEPRIIAESGAMTEYLCEYFAPHLIPKRYREGMEGQIGGESEEWMRYRFFMHYAEGSLMSLMLISVFIDQIAASPVPFFIKPVTRGIADKVYNLYLTDNFAAHFAFLNGQLETSPQGGEYLCGKELTAADIMLSFPLMASVKRGKIEEGANAKLRAYVKKLEEDETHVKSVKEVEEKTGEKYDVV
ncbi:hypothetical protein MBLNU230_g1253t2 [Neophaeotheca triangularis]